MIEPALMELIDDYYHQQAMLSAKLVSSNNNIDQLIDTLFVDIMSTEMAYEKLVEVKKVNNFYEFDFATYRNEDFYVTGNRLIIASSKDTILSKYKIESTVQGSIGVSQYKMLVYNYEIKSFIDHFLSYNMYVVMQADTRNQSYKRSYQSVGM